LLLVPIVYLLLEDLKAAARRYWLWQWGKDVAPAPERLEPAVK
jgi:hypothetical protein